MKDHVAYIRVSTKEQGDSGLGLKAQISWIDKHFPDRDRDFIEIGSGTSMEDRPIFMEALNYCIKHKKTLVVQKVDRLCRNAEEGHKILRLLQNRVRIAGYSGEMPKLIIGIYFLMAEVEADFISHRTQVALDELKKQGVPLGTNNPKCKNNFAKVEYKQAGANAMKQKSKDNPENQKSYEYALSLKEQGYTLQMISERLNKANVTSTGGKWYKGSVSRLLKRHSLG